MGAELVLRPQASTSPETPSAWEVAPALGCFTLGLLCGGYAAVAKASGGPLPACDEHGMWVRVRKFPARAMWMSWGEIAFVFVGRWGLSRFVCVAPLDSQTGKGHGVIAAWDQAMSKLFFGARFSVHTLTADCGAQEICQAIEYWSGGRVRQVR